VVGEKSVPQLCLLPHRRQRLTERADLCSHRSLRSFN